MSSMLRDLHSSSHKLDGWIVRRIWSHRFRRWRTRAWIQLPKVTPYEGLGLVNLIYSNTFTRLSLLFTSVFLKAVCTEIGTYS